MVTGYRLLLERREPDRRARSRNAQRKASHGYSLKMGQASLFGMGRGPSFLTGARLIQGHGQPTRYRPRPETDGMSRRARFTCPVWPRGSNHRLLPVSRNRWVLGTGRSSGIQSHQTQPWNNISWPFRILSPGLRHVAGLPLARSQVYN